MELAARLLSSMIVLVCLSVNVFANATTMSLFNERYAVFYDENLDIELTSGFLKDFEGTFDSSRTITGHAPKGAELIISVYQYDEINDCFVVFFEDNLTVGSSGVFSSSINLALGENYIVVSSEQGQSGFCKMGLIKRKDKEIKLELEQGVGATLPSSMLSANSN